MSCQNDKNAFHINALTRLNDDYTEKESKIRYFKRCNFLFITVRVAI